MKEKFISYKRIAGQYSEDEIEKLFKGFIKSGYEIISYSESEKKHSNCLCKGDVLYDKLYKKASEENKKTFPPSIIENKFDIVVIIGKQQLA